MIFSEIVGSRYLYPYGSAGSVCAELANEVEVGGMWPSVRKVHVRHHHDEGPPLTPECLAVSIKQCS